MSGVENITRADGKIVGFVKDNIFRKRVRGSIHLMKKYDGWGLDLSILKSLPENCEIRVLDEEKRVVYTTTKEEWEAKGIADEIPPHEIQKFLARSHFKVSQLA